MPAFQDFQQPGYLHVLLNHLPIYGLAIAALGLLIALVLRSRPAQVTALLLVLVTALSAWPVAATGQRSYKAVRGLADDDGVDWLDEHMERAEKFVPVFYVLSALAAAGLALPRRWPSSATPLASGCFGIAGYIAYAGGKIRHTEFRHTTRKITRKNLNTLTKRMTRLLTLFTALLLGGCATAPPPLASTSPASPDAPEGTRVQHHESLRADETTSETRKLISAAQKEQEHWDKYGPVSGTPEEAPQSEMKMEMHHDQH